MATVLAFDNINKLGDAKPRPTYTEWFDKMDVTPEQKRKRVRLADILEDEILLFFGVYLAAMRYAVEVDKIRAEREYIENLRAALKDTGIRDRIIDNYIDDVVRGEIDVTNRRFRDGDYWLSQERAQTIAQDDSNTLWNGEEYQEAVDEGKTEKQWLTMKDERVRPTHVEVDDEIVPIDEPFVVGNSLMLFPHDSSLGADVSELAGCRCACIYL